MPFVQVDPSQINFDKPSVAMSGFVPVDPSKIQFDKPSFMDRVSGDILNRANEGADAIVAYRNGDQGLMQTGLQLAGKMGAGTAGDIAGETIKSAYQSLPQNIQDAGKKVADYVSDSPVGDVARQYAGNYQDFANNNPNAARSIESVVDLASVLPASKAVEVVAQPASGASVAAGNALVKAAQAGIDAITPTEIQSAESLRNMASQAYKQAGSQNGLLNPSMSNAFIDKINQILPQEARVKEMVGDSPATKIIDNLQSWKDTPITFDEADQLDKLLTKKMQASSAVDSLTGKLTSEGNDLLDIQHALRDTMDMGGKGFDTLTQARQLWSASMRQQQLENIVQRAKMTDNPQTAIRTGFKNLANNPARLRGFTDDEIDAINKAAKTGLLTGALKFAGSRLISSVAGATGGAAGGGFLGAGLGAAAGGLIGTPFRMAADAIQEGKAKNVMRAISERPVVRGIP